MKNRADRMENGNTNENERGEGRGKSNQKEEGKEVGMKKCQGTNHNH